MVSSQQRLGALLVDMGFIDDAQLASALEEQQRTDKRLGKILVEAAVLSEDRLVHALSRQLGIEACDPIMTRVHERVLALVPPDLAFKYRVLPVARQREADRRDVVYVATADPLDPEALQAVSDTLGAQARVQWMLAGETEMELALARHYGRSVPDGPKVVTGVPIAGPPRSPEEEAGSRAVLASTDDVLAALQPPSDGATTQPDQPLPSDRPVAAKAPESLAAPVGIAPPGTPPVGVAPPGTPPESGELPLSALSDSSTEEILIAEEVVTAEEGAALLALPQLNAMAAGLLPSDRPDSSPMASPGSNLARDRTPGAAFASTEGPPFDLEASVSLDLVSGPIIDEPRSDDITDELLQMDTDPPPAGAFGAVEPSWGDLIDVGPPTRPGIESVDLGLKRSVGVSKASVSLTELAGAVEALPVAEASLPGPRPRSAPAADPLDHPAAPFPPLEGEPEIDEPEDEPQIDLDALVEKLIEPGAPLSTLPLPSSSQETATSIQHEIEYFVAGGALDLSSQQRVLRAIAAVMMQQGLLEPGRIEAALKSFAPSPEED